MRWYQKINSDKNWLCTYTKLPNRGGTIERHYTSSYTYYFLYTSECNFCLFHSYPFLYTGDMNLRHLIYITFYILVNSLFFHVSYPFLYTGAMQKPRQVAKTSSGSCKNLVLVMWPKRGFCKKNAKTSSGWRGFLQKPRQVLQKRFRTKAYYYHLLPFAWSASDLKFHFGCRCAICSANCLLYSYKFAYW